MLMWLWETFISNWQILSSLFLSKGSFISQMEHTTWLCFWNFTMSRIYSHRKRNGTGAQRTWPVLLYRTKPVSTTYSSAMVDPSVLWEDITVRPPYPHFQIRLRLFFNLFWQWKINDWNSYHIFLKQSTWTVMTSRQRHIFPGCLAKEPDPGVMLMEWCGHIQTAACKHLLLCFLLYVTWPNHSPGLHRNIFYLCVHF